MAAGMKSKKKPETGEALDNHRGITGGFPNLSRKGLDPTKFPIDGVLKQIMASNAVIAEISSRTDRMLIGNHLIGEFGLLG